MCANQRHIKKASLAIERLLLDSLKDGKSVRMTEKRRQRIYHLALVKK
jgi:hypothetical protein